MVTLPFEPFLVLRRLCSFYSEKAGAAFVSVDSGWLM